MPLKAITVLILLLCFCSSSWSLSIAVIVWRGETSAEAGFKDRLIELGYSPQYHVFNAEQDKEKLSHILRDDIAQKIDQFDYVYTFGTTISKATQQTLSEQKPHIFNIVTDPIGAGLVTNKEGGGKNIAGASNAIEPEDLVVKAKEVLSLKRVAAPFNRKEKNAHLQIQQLKNIGKKYDIEIIPIPLIPDEDRYLEGVKSILTLQNIDAVYFVSSSFMISKSEEIMPILTDAKLPTLCSVSNYVKSGCLMGSGANYKNLGRLAADILDQHQKGKDLEDIPVQYDEKPEFLFNEDTQKSLGIVIKQ